MAHLRLTMEPIPTGSRLASLAKLLSPGQWDILRRSVYRRAGYRCRACGREDRLHCHEVWQYNPRTRYQHLAGFRALCPACHAATHITHASNRRRQALLRHYVVTNRLKLEEGRGDLEAAIRRQHWLDRLSWTLIYSNYNLRTPAAKTPCVRRRYARREGAGDNAPLLPPAQVPPLTVMAVQRGDAAVLAHRR